MHLDKEKAVRELGIPEEMYSELLRVFIEQTEEPLNSLVEKIKSGNFEEIAKTAHFIKGSAGNLRIDEIYSIAKDIELGAKEQQDINTLGDNASKLRSAFEELKNIIGKPN